MRALVTLCNKHRAPDVAPGVLVVELRFDAAAIHDPSSIEILPHRLELPETTTGITGVAVLDGRLLLGLQSRLPALAIADRQLNIEEIVRLHATRDVHSLLAHGGFVFMASTGTDQITTWSPGSPDVVVTTVGSGESDTLHLNCLTIHDDELVASRFGPKDPAGWLQTHHGEIFEVESGEVLSAANHPHSVISRAGELLWCESNEHRLANGTDVLTLDHGYCRGLAAVGEYVLVGTSVRRTASRSTGQKVADTEVGDCGVAIVQWPPGKPLSAAREVGFVSLRDWGREIYEVFIIGE